MGIVLRLGQLLDYQINSIIQYFWELLKERSLI